MDDLDYSYNGNQLTAVLDNVTATNQGFIDGNTVGNDYTYDVNGNMVEDKNKSITSISYNHLNLPKQVNFTGGNNISYVYDATGMKLSKTVNDVTNSTVTTTQYAGNFIYKNNTLEFFNHPEGYIEPTGNGLNPYIYIYQYKDHLGNIRLSYADDDHDGHVDIETVSTGDSDGDGVITHELREENNYYPFGLKHQGYNNVITGRDHKYDFGGKEYQEELNLEWYDVSVRNYDPALGTVLNRCFLNKHI